MAQAAIGQNTEHPLQRQNESWSLERQRQYLETFPLTQQELNSRYARQLFDEVDQKNEVLSKQMDECASIVKDLQQKEKKFKQILNNLKPLFQRLDERKDFLRSIFASPAEVEEIKQQVLELVREGRQICPDYPGFVNFDENVFLKG